MTKALIVNARPVPLTQDAHGVWRVTGSRIPLERVVEAYLDGESPESIVDAFDTLRLADVYAVIAYYLDHKEEVEEYLRQAEEEANEIQRMIDTIQPLRPGFCEELLARKARLEQKDAQDSV